MKNNEEKEQEQGQEQEQEQRAESKKANIELQSHNYTQHLESSLKQLANKELTSTGYITVVIIRYAFLDHAACRSVLKPGHLLAHQRRLV